MGWSFSCIDIGRDAHIAEITSQKHFSADYKPLAHRVVGNNVWQCVEQVSTGRRFITLDMIAKDRNGGWGYKGMSEDCGPSQVNCPLSLLDMCTEARQDGYGAGWRQKVREYHAAKRTASKPAQGATVTYGGHQYRLDAPAGPRRGWHVTRVGDGRSFRMNAQQLSQALKGTV